MSADHITRTQLLSRIESSIPRLSTSDAMVLHARCEVERCTLRGDLPTDQPKEDAVDGDVTHGRPRAAGAVCRPAARGHRQRPRNRAEGARLRAERDRRQARQAVRLDGQGPVVIYTFIAAFTPT